MGKLSVLLGVGLGVSLMFGFAGQAFAVKVGDVLPKLTVKDDAGKSVEPWAGKKTLINFWATWCDACKVELKEMQSEVKHLPSDRQVVFVSLDKDPKKAKEYFTKEFKGASPMVSRLFYDQAFEMAERLEVESFPMTLVVDETGKVIQVQEGFKPGEGSTEKLFQTLKKPTM
jgi:thiol-disulfide isomerase/thioredoxin